MCSFCNIVGYRKGHKILGLKTKSTDIFWTYRWIYLNLYEMFTVLTNILSVFFPRILKRRQRVVMKKIHKQLFWNDLSERISLQKKRRSQKDVDKDGTLNFLLKHTGSLIAFERVGRASASPNASVNWVGKWRRLLSALGMEAREAKSFAPHLCVLDPHH